ncbi:MAG TPA: hypothetical protein VKP88_04545, partial [Candidatus Paceibacterota bacterium]|nr:hypothetical protein [Candidatus Paceibacterota bacterium]
LIQFVLDIKALESSEPGRVFPTIVNFTSTNSLSGTEFAALIDINDYYSITFEDGAYQLVLNGANSNITDVLNLNSVQVIPQNSAGLVSLAEINNALKSVNDTVYYNSSTGEAGTTSGIGQPDLPSNNLEDVIAISTRDSKQRINVGTSLTVDETLVGYTVVTQGTNNYLTLTGTNTSGLSAQDLIVTGTQNGVARFFTCTVGALTGFDGMMRNCGFVQSPLPQTSAAIAIAATTTQNPRLIDCFESDPSGLYPVIDMGAGTSTRLAMQNYRGRIGIQNLDNENKRVEINLSGGQVFLDSSCTAGTLVLEGYGGSVVLNGATCTVQGANFISPASGSGAFTESDRTALNSAAAQSTAANTAASRLTEQRATNLDDIPTITTNTATMLTRWTDALATTLAKMGRRVGIGGTARHTTTAITTDSESYTIAQNGENDYSVSE